MPAVNAARHSSGHVTGIAVTKVANRRAQIPVDSDLQGLFKAVICDGDVEVRQVYRLAAGPRYTEQWVLDPNYSFDRIRETGPSIEIVAETRGFRGVRDFLKRVPFPAGSC